MSSLNTVTYPARGWIHTSYNNKLNRAHTSNNSNPYKDTASFKHVMLSSVIEPTEAFKHSVAIHDPKFDRHIGFRVPKCHF